jgi:energy-coupling factor transporter ATP-binding protein EcfA2
VGVELITSPTCLFLDEPTSGLDSEIAVSIMRTLKNIAAKGRTLALTIHQPNSDITELFDHFILMAKGEIVYGGAHPPPPQNPGDSHAAAAAPLQWPAPRAAGHVSSRTWRVERCREWQWQWRQDASIHLADACPHLHHQDTLQHYEDE